jgi:hypothetical protein
MTEKAIDLSMAWGLSPNKRLNETAPNINALPRDSFLLMHTTTKTKTIKIRRMAGIWANINILLFLMEIALNLIAKMQLSDSRHEIKKT